MKVVVNAPLARSPFPGIQHVTLAGSPQGLSQLSIWHQVLAPASATPPHRHDCEEVVMCISGRGALLFNDGKENRRLDFGPNNTVCIPRNELHQLINDGDEPLHINAVFSRSPVEAFFPDGQPVLLPWAS
jgi:mannose-6-phosphate isomerase-like protein (cupin superfamily)